MKRFLSILLAAVLCLSMLTSAIATGADAVFTFKSATVKAGDVVAIDLSLKSAVSINSIAVSGFSFGEDLEFMGFSGYEHFEDMTLLPATFDEELMAIAIPLKTSVEYDGKICTLNFKVKDSAEQGDCEVSAGNVVIKNNSTPYTAAAQAATVSITRENFTGLSLSDKTVTYDGAEQVLTVLGEVPTGATITYTNNAATNVGEYDVTATVQKSGYNDLVLTAKLIIDPKPLTINGLVAEDKVYDGTKDAKLTGGVLTGIVSDDDVAVEMPTQGVFTKSDVGTSISVRVEAIELQGEKKNNYTLTQPTGLKADISKRELTVKAKDYAIRQNTEVPALEYEIVSGDLVPGDTLSGKMSVSADGSRVGTFTIKRGTLAAGDNYDFTFQTGTLSVLKKEIQGVTVAALEIKTYGDDPFSVEVTDDDSTLGALSFISSNPDVAAVDADGTITVKGAGKTTITVSRSGSDDYADFTASKVLTVEPRQIEVTADAASKRVGTEDPAQLTYRITKGELVAGDAFTGALTRKTGEAIGNYAIQQGTLALSKNYTIRFIAAEFSIIEKAPQTITITQPGDVTYGDESFKLQVVDENADLGAISYNSSDADVVSVDEAGTISVNGAGTATITLSREGNDDYAAMEKTVDICVDPKSLVVTEIDPIEMAVELEGVLEKDADISIDFTRLRMSIVETVSDDTSRVNVTNFCLVGAAGKNYKVVTEAVAVIVRNDTVATVTVEAENGEVVGAGTYRKGSNVQLSVTPDRGYRFAGWYVNGEKTETGEQYSFIIDADVSVEARFAKKATASGGGVGGGSSTTKEEDSKVTVDPVTGNKTTITTNKDGSVTEVVETKDGVTVTTNKDKYGSSDTTVVVSPAETPALAPVFLPVEDKEQITIKVTGAVKVEIPVKKVTPGTVAAVVASDGTEKIIFNTKVTEESVIISLSEDCAIRVFDNSKVFNDVSGHWASDAIAYASARNLFAGTGDGSTFSPDVKMTRAMVAQVIYNLEGSENHEHDANFTDISADAWYCRAINWAAREGIVSGYGDGSYKPDKTLTREEVVQIFYNYAKYKGCDVSASADLASFADGDLVSDWAREAKSWGVGAGLISGKGGNILDANGGATRGEGAQMFMNFCNRIAE